ncbi:Helix-turn-helix domain [Anaerobutyricum hallii]|uniref:Helix-turn-helix domain n=1 Tax=Anaerobutyricum hallii TaxID=39488 RepID=A0A285PT73_9FIRM|nr:helix-turn-helix domain-containing protein [Anaerobutyricum hallii]SOB72833.1 Helix-turn-helix domain [Anaerobutyricum hallii]
MAYIVIQDWMISDLQLKGNELLTYALIYGFSQDGESEFKGSLKYISEFLGVSKRTAQRSIENLVDRGIVEKRVEEISGVKFNRYMAHKEADTPIDKMTMGYSQNDHGGIVKMTMGYSQNDHGGIVKMTTNNTNIYNANNNTSNNTKDKDTPARYFDDEELNNKFMEFLSMRKKIRKPVRTDRALKALLKKLHELSGGDVGLMKQIIDQSLDKEWLGLFELKTGNDNTKNINDRLYGDIQHWAAQKEQEGGGMYDDFGVF